MDIFNLEYILQLNILRVNLFILAEQLGMGSLLPPEENHAAVKMFVTEF